MNEQGWKVMVSFAADGRDALQAAAILTAGYDQLVGHGHTRKNPSDPHVPAVAAEMAAARALEDLALKLRHLADEQIATWDSDVYLFPLPG